METYPHSALFYKCISYVLFVQCFKLWIGTFTNLIEWNNKTLGNKFALIFIKHNNWTLWEFECESWWPIAIPFKTKHMWRSEIWHKIKDSKYVLRYGYKLKTKNGRIRKIIIIYNRNERLNYIW